MLVKKSDRKKHVNAKTCIAYEYPTKDKDINVSFIEIKGRYPEKGRVVNKVCKEIMFAVNGKGIVTVENKKFLLNKEDVVLIKPNKKYFFDGKMNIIVICQPSWFPEQHVECD